jgi:uncharacterized protein (DUF1810 family)
MHSTDPFNLHRFVDAQATTFAQAHAELELGQKRTHWMWFIFPQIAGLGSSPTAQRFAIRSMDEATAYLAHPLLGPRLRDCTALVLTHPTRAVSDIFPYPDDLKFHSSLTLFAVADPDTPLFRSALDTFFHSQRDEATLALLGTMS